MSFCNPTREDTRAAEWMVTVGVGVGVGMGGVFVDGG